LIALAVWLLPLLDFTVLIFLNKRLPRNGDWFGTSILFTMVASVLTILFVKLGSYHDQVLQATFTWIDLGNVSGIGPMKIELGMMIDNVTAIMLVVVCTVSAFVHLYSIGYMHGDIRYGRYYAYLGLFTFSMLGIVLTNNFFIMYVSWELVGICSYLLIGHWFEKKSASDASKKAFIVNRVGDVGMFIGIFILFTTYHSFRFDVIFDAIRVGNIPFGSEAWLTAAGLLIFCGAVGKSAQFPLHVWLPDAMEGPTPVSALIHAATMVAAGVYLVTRTFAMMTGDALTVIAYVGAFTAFFAATIALTQNDIKKVLAYSTISQLGYMIMGLGVGAYTAGFFHLTTHAMFKAGLFLGAGSVIHGMHRAMHETGDHETDPQDLRNMGGLRERMPITYLAFLMYTLAITGIPFTSGFMSKDEILSGTLAYGALTGHYLIPILAFFAVGMTAFYMFRVVILAFLGEHQNRRRYDLIKESPAVMTIPLVVFAVLSFFMFYSFNPVDASSGWLYKAVERPESVVPLAAAAVNKGVFEGTADRLHFPAMALSLAIAGLGILLAFAMYRWKKIDADALVKKPVVKWLYQGSLNKWYVDEAYEFIVVGGTKGIAKILSWFDGAIVDGVVNGAAKLTIAVTHGVKKTWDGDKIPTVLYAVGCAGISLLIGWLAMNGMIPDWCSVWKIVEYGIFGLAVSGLTFFMLFIGIGAFDAKVVDGMVNLVASAFGFFGLLIRRIQTGKVQTYIVFVLFGVMVFFLWFR
jgi:NADH-quinone oxidoreductase subunit L